MHIQGEQNLLKFLKTIYTLALAFLFVMVIVTAYGLSHPELDLVETNPLVHAYTAAYGLVGALLIAMLVNASVLIFSALFFTLYRMFQKRYNWHNPLIDAIAYALVATFGLSALITWLLNAAKDVHVLLFHSSHPAISAMWSVWDNMTLYLMVAMFVVLFLLLHVRRMPAREKEVTHSKIDTLSL